MSLKDTFSKGANVLDIINFSLNQQKNPCTRLVIEISTSFSTQYYLVSIPQNKAKISLSTFLKKSELASSRIGRRAMRAILSARPSASLSYFLLREEKKASA